MSDSAPAAGWIVNVEGRNVAAGPTRTAALRNARGAGFEGGDARRASAREIVDLDLPHVAIWSGPGDDVRTDGGRWWTTGWFRMLTPEPEQGDCRLPWVPSPPDQLPRCASFRDVAFPVATPFAPCVRSARAPRRCSAGPSAPKWVPVRTRDGGRTVGR